jgi:predicted CoA-binding protein
MIPVKQAASEFLAQQRIAVTGVSRSPKDHGANVVYKRLRERGYEVYPVNPNAERVEGDLAFADLKSVPGGVDGVVIATSPAHAQETMREAVDLGIRRVWMHRGPGAGSVSEEATRYGRERGVTVIDGGCPCMFGPTADTGHKIRPTPGTR